MISLTVSLIAVFIPLLFMTGLVGRMFREFALTLTIAVVVSAIVSLTLTPMMCGQLLRSTHGREPSFLARAAEWPMSALTRLYSATLGWALARRGFMLFLTFGTLALTGYLYLAIPKGFLPRQDTGLLTVVLQGSPDVSFAEMSRLQNAVSVVISKDEDVAGVVAVLGIGTLNATTNVGRLSVTLKPRDIRTVSADAIGVRLTKEASTVPGATVFVEPVQDIQITTRVSRSQYQYTLTGTDAAEVDQWAASLADQLQSVSTFRNIALETQDGGLRTFIEIDREKAGRLGISVQNIDDTLNDAFGQRQISTIYAQANQYRVILEGAAISDGPHRPRQALCVGFDQHGVGDRARRLVVPDHDDRRQRGTASAAGVALREHDAAMSIAHEEQFPAATISFNLAPDASLGDAVDAISRAEQEIDLPPSVTGSFSADAAEFNRSLAGEPWLILAAVVTIYIVLGVLYESFIHPLTILSTLPSAGVGALLALMLFGQDLSVIALIGIVLLMGIVKKNAIMMIDFAIEAERNDGLSPKDAIVRGLPSALPPDHDDDARRAVRRAAARARRRHRLRAAHPARHHHHRRLAAEPVADALHDAGDLSRLRGPARPFLGHERTAAPADRGDRAHAGTRTAAWPGSGGVMNVSAPSSAGPSARRSWRSGCS